MQDRVPVNPGRVLVTPENGGAAYYATLTRADNPTQGGTPLNKASLLKDATAALFGLGTDAVPDDVFSFIGKYNQHWWRLTGKVQVNEYGEATVQNVCYTGSSGTMKKFTYGTGFTVDEDLNVTLTDTSFFWYTPNDISAEKLSVLKGKYFFYNNAGTETAPLLYCLPTSEDATKSSSYWSMTCQIITPMWKDDGETLVQSNDRNAYPDNGMVDGTFYQYLGIPFQNAVTAPKIATGSYTGTGTYGASNPTSLTFDFAPQIVWLYGYVAFSTFNPTNSSAANYNVMSASVLTESYIEGAGFGLSSGTRPYGKKSSDGKTFAWYGSSDQNQFNYANYVYYYIAIG